VPHARHQTAESERALRAASWWRSGGVAKWGGQGPGSIPSDYCRAWQARRFVMRLVCKPSDLLWDWYAGQSLCYVVGMQNGVGVSVRPHNKSGPLPRAARPQYAHPKAGHLNQPGLEPTLPPKNRFWGKGEWTVRGAVCVCARAAHSINRLRPRRLGKSHRFAAPPAQSKHGLLLNRPQVKGLLFRRAEPRGKETRFDPNAVGSRKPGRAGAHVAGSSPACQNS
jgi:hypothetical protein